MERLARPPDTDSFPKKVTYESACGCQCRNTEDVRRINLHCNLVTALAEIVRRDGSPLDSMRADILCGFEVWDISKKKLEFAWLTAASARSGVHKPDQVSVIASEVGACSNFGSDSRPAPGLLDLKTLPRVECFTSYLPASNGVSASCGQLHMLSADALLFVCSACLTMRVQTA